ncbi:MAG: hypothetical protein M3416_07420 [Acidobacteriota bacterium]|nr:hypothetical protein [Acidobacteriota bacterium]
MRFASALLTLASALACGSALFSSRPPHETQTPPAPGQPTPAAAVQGAAKKTVTHDGVSLSFDTALAADVKPAAVPATPLQAETDKPEGVWPRHTAFTFHKTPAEKPGPDSNYPSVRVGPVDEYRRAVSVSKRLTGELDAVLEKLRALLRGQPRTLTKDVPTLHFPDATEAFHTHVKYLKFARGTGVAYLTQVQQEPSLINNEQMTYEFRGLTDDGRHYVYASFPVAVPFLPATRDVSTHDGYTLPDIFYGEREEENARAYQAYVTRVKARLEGLPPDGFTPSLRLLDEMLSSLEVNK